MKTRMGTSNTTIHAPRSNFVTMMTTATIARHDGADGIDDHRAPPARPALLAQSPPANHHAGLREGEGRKDAQRVEVDQGVGVAVERNQQHDREQAEDDDARCKRQPVATKMRIGAA